MFNNKPHSYCKECYRVWKNGLTKSYRKDKPESFKSASRKHYLKSKFLRWLPYILSSLQACSDCKQDKELSEFGTGQKSPIDNRCRLCRSRYNRSYHKNYRDSHLEQELTKQKRWRRNNRHKMALQQAKRRSAQGTCSSEQWLQKCIFYGWKCCYCDKPLTPKTVTMEHKIPISKGGTNWPANLAPACGPCNYGKGNKSFHEFIGEITCP